MKNKQFAIALTVTGLLAAGGATPALAADTTSTGDTSSPTAASAAVSNTTLAVWRSEMSKLNIRSGPSWDSPVIDSTDSYTLFNGTGPSGGWVKIGWKGQTGYVPASYVWQMIQWSTQADYKVVDTMWLSVRSGPSTSYQRLGYLPGGDVITDGTMTTSGWVRFTHEGRTAYVSGKYLTETYRELLS